jgi:hypothetical protein
MCLAVALSRARKFQAFNRLTRHRGVAYRLPERLRGGPRMSSDEQVTRAIADEIERYLQQHPIAADSAEGIRTWWLPPRLRGSDLASVLRALEQLEARGLVCRREMQGVATMFSSTASTAGPKR